MNTIRFNRYCGSLLSTAIFFAALVGVTLLVFSSHTIYRNRIARQWPLTDGRIISSQTFLQDASGGEPGNATVARADVRFAYEVNGHPYQSSNVSYDGAIGATNHVYSPDYAVTYPAGTLVNVAYNPASPAEAVVDTSRDPYLTFSASLALIAGFVGYQIWLRRGAIQ